MDLLGDFLSQVTLKMFFQSGERGEERERERETERAREREREKERENITYSDHLQVTSVNTC